jgi:V/A-type H+-transporting ATPase subunit I
LADGRPLVIAQPAAEVLVIVPRGEYARTVRVLAESGLFQPEPLEAAPPELRRLRGEIDTLIEKLRSILHAAGLPERSERVRVKLESREDAGISRVIAAVNELTTALSQLAEKIAELKNPESELSKRLRILGYYSFIDVDLRSLARAAHVRAKVYRVQPQAVDGFLQALAGIEGVVAVEFTGIEPGMATIVAVYPAKLEAEVGKAALRFRAEPLEIPEGWPQTPRALVEEVRRLLEKLPEEIGRKATDLYRALSMLEAASRLVALLEASSFSKYTAAIHGYVEPSGLGRLEEAIASAGVRGYVIVEAARSRSEHSEGHSEEEWEAQPPPSIYHVPKPLRPFADLLAMAGHPRPGEVVPVVFMAVTLPIIYGLMFPDLGHGLTLILVGYYLFYKVMRNEPLWRLMLYLGAAAMVTGFLAGEFFGPHPLVAGWLAHGVWHGHPPLESPLHLFVEGGEHGVELAEAAKHLLFNAIYLSLTVGAIVMTLGSVLAIVNGVTLRDREVLVAGLGKTLVFGSILLALTAGAAVGAGGTALERAAHVLGDAGLTLVPKTSLGLVVRSIFTVGLLAVLVAPIAFGHGSAGKRAIGGLIEAFDILLMAIGNTASFMRIMGLMLAHSGLMFGFTILAEMAGPIGGAITYIFGNILTIGLEALVAYAHSLRLHFYEMFSKFYLDEGRAYTPLKLPETVVLEA